MRIRQAGTVTAMNRLREVLSGLDWRVLAGLLILSVVLGIANNFRVYEEQRLPFFAGFGGEDE